MGVVSIVHCDKATSPLKIPKKVNSSINKSVLSILPINSVTSFLTGNNRFRNRWLSSHSVFTKPSPIQKKDIRHCHLMAEKSSKSIGQLLADDFSKINDNLITLGDDYIKRIVFIQISKFSSVFPRLHIFKINLSSFPCRG